MTESPTEPDGKDDAEVERGGDPLANIFSWRDVEEGDRFLLPTGMVREEENGKRSFTAVTVEVVEAEQDFEEWDGEWL